MLITPLQLVDEPLAIDEIIQPGTIDYTLDLRQTSPLPIQGSADLLVERRDEGSHVNDIRLRAAYHGDFEILCARCVEPVALPLSGEFDLLFRPEEADAVAGEHSITPDETEIGYYQESGLSLEDVVREQVLLSLPGRTLCKEDCKGLCPRCGQNLNLANCSCDAAPANPQWNALADLASKLELKH
ncbi:MULTISPECIES: DUF177 domain-containing protein [Acidobacteriaceae]|uniref:YceD family protein n=1 Tax=Acidobacteriaceae TaxID=204434 RepID=UPI00131D9F03|nr:MULTISPECIES: DUF177 domain-containing protein [Acidobacteriaceae]MDW5267218.1 DUF177 domain-containing protein [Edaphobacter sp.]